MAEERIIIADGLPTGDISGLILPMEIVWPIGGPAEEIGPVVCAAFIKEGVMKMIRKQATRKTATKHLNSCVIDLIIRQEQPTLYHREE